MNELIKKAKEYPHHMLEPTEEKIELALAWARGEVTLLQVSRALGHKSRAGSGSYVTLARSLRAYLHREKLI